MRIAGFREGRNAPAMKSLFEFGTRDLRSLQVTVETLGRGLQPDHHGCIFECFPHHCRFDGAPAEDDDMTWSDRIENDPLFFLPEFLPSVLFDVRMMVAMMLLKQRICIRAFPLEFGCQSFAEDGLP